MIERIVVYPLFPTQIYPHTYTNIFIYLPPEVLFHTDNCASFSSITSVTYHHRGRHPHITTPSGTSSPHHNTVGDVIPASQHRRGRHPRITTPSVTSPPHLSLSSSSYHNTVDNLVTIDDVTIEGEAADINPVVTLNNQEGTQDMSDLIEYVTKPTQS